MFIQKNNRGFMNNIGESHTCCICLDEIEKSSKQLQCAHKFHKICIDGWFKRQEQANDSPSCPLCKDVQAINPSSLLTNEELSKQKLKLLTVAVFTAISAPLALQSEQPVLSLIIVTVLMIVSFVNLKLDILTDKKNSFV